MSVLGDSMLRGLDIFIKNPALEVVSTECIGKAAASGEADKVMQHVKKHHPEILVSHCGTNSITKKTFKVAKDGVQKLISNAMCATESTKIIISRAIQMMQC